MCEFPTWYTAWMQAVDPTCELFVPLVIVGFFCALFVIAALLAAIMGHYAKRVVKQFRRA